MAASADGGGVNACPSLRSGCAPYSDLGLRLGWRWGEEHGERRSYSDLGPRSGGRCGEANGLGRKDRELGRLGCERLPFASLGLRSLLRSRAAVGLAVRGGERRAAPLRRSRAAVGRAGRGGGRGGAGASRDTVAGVVTRAV